MSWKFGDKRPTYISCSSYVRVIFNLNGIFLFNSLAIAKEGELTIGTIDDIQKLHIRSIPLGEQARRICHQEQSRTFAICSLKYSQSSSEESEVHFIRLLDDQTFEIISTYALDTFECGCSILSCSFSDDNNVYYCVGTAYVLPEENEPSKVVFHEHVLFCLQLHFVWTLNIALIVSREGY